MLVFRKNITHVLNDWFLRLLVSHAKNLNGDIDSNTSLFVAVLITRNEQSKTKCHTH